MAGYTFEGGFPTPETVRQAYDDADLNRAVQACRFFFPTVSGAAIVKGNTESGLVANTTFGVLVVAMDVNQRWVADMGVPGPDAGQGGRHLFLPPRYAGTIPSGHHVWRSTTDCLIVGVRSLPVDGDVKGALDRDFGPTAPAGKQGQWIKTLPGKGWFVYFRIYGPEPPAFDRRWKPDDFEKIAA